MNMKTLLWLAQILVVIFGQDLPDATASLAAQVFGLCVALLGLATFALVLALLQQVQRCMAGPALGCLRSPHALPLVLEASCKAAGPRHLCARAGAAAAGAKPSTRCTACSVLPLH